MAKAEHRVGTLRVVASAMISADASLTASTVRSAVAAWLSVFAVVDHDFDDAAACDRWVAGPR